MAKLQCPLCAKPFDEDKDIIAHFKKEHKEVKNIRIGKKKINLEKK